MKKLTVLMTVYNENIDILKKSIDSILNQTFKDFTFLIILDNPKNFDAINIIKKYSKLDDRVKYCINEKNIGLPLSLNKGIELIKTNYIARMDADDISLPCRLEKQMNYIINNSKVSILGSNIINIDFNGNIIYRRSSIPTKYNDIQCIMKYMNVFNHPTLIGKTEVFKKLKYRNLKYSQDYDFMCRVIENGYHVENLSDYLLKYRFNNETDYFKRTYQQITRYNIQKYYKKEKLSGVEIKEIVEDDIEKVNMDKFIKYFRQYDYLLEYSKKKNILKIIHYTINLLLSSSKYIREDTLNLYRYFYYKKIFKI